MLGLPYVFGGRDVARQGGLDCAGFVLVTFHRLGINLTNNADYDTGLWLTNAQRLYDGDTLQTPVTHTDDPQPGDLVFYQNTYDTGGDQISHVAILVSPGRMVGAQGDAAGFVNFGASPYWMSHLVGYGHVSAPPAPSEPNPDDVVSMILSAADTVGIPRDMAYACAMAESGDPPNPRAERWGARTEDAVAAINAGDMDELQAVLNTTGYDVSFGVGQQIIAYHYAGDRTATWQNCMVVREQVFNNPEENMLDMCQRLAGYLASAEESDLTPVGGDAHLAALVHYNSGGYPPKASYWANYAGNVAGYRKALANARARLA